jgi:mRNA-degrading endonuclease RelE of RelBE toxin-antitoxin system
MQAQEQFSRLPLTVKERVRDVFERLASWPSVSGAKTLRGALVGHFRIRTGDWRIVFRVVAPNVVVVTIAHRSKVYE